MRNALRFLSLLLVCVLGVGLWAPAAKADMCYEVIKRFFENADNETVTYLGKGTRFETEPSDYVIFMVRCRQRICGCHRYQQCDRSLRGLRLVRCNRQAGLPRFH